jgi:rhodanese-related sulfurtransferase
VVEAQEPFSTLTMVEKKFTILIIIVSLLVGSFSVLAFRALKYTPLIDPKIADIDPLEAYENILKNPKDILLIDVRSENEYNQAHASSSISLPIHYFYDDTHGLKNEKGVPLPKNTNQEIYLLCTGGRLAGVAYSYLEHYGYRNIKRIEGGIKNWNDKGLPVITKNLFGNSYVEKSYGNPFPLDKPYDARKP